MLSGGGLQEASSHQQLMWRKCRLLAAGESTSFSSAALAFSLQVHLRVAESASYGADSLWRMYGIGTGQAYPYSGGECHAECPNDFSDRMMGQDIILMPDNSSVVAQYQQMGPHPDLHAC